MWEGLINRTLSDGRRRLYVSTCIHTRSADRVMSTWERFCGARTSTRWARPAAPRRQGVLIRAITAHSSSGGISSSRRSSSRTMTP